MFGVEAHVGIGMKDLGEREPALRQRFDPLPGQAVRPTSRALAALAKPFGGLEGCFPAVQCGYARRGAISGGRRPDHQPVDCDLSWQSDSRWMQVPACCNSM
jgi:hypothetical protein